MFVELIEYGRRLIKHVFCFLKRPLKLDFVEEVYKRDNEGEVNKKRDECGKKIERHSVFNIKLIFNFQFSIYNESVPMFIDLLNNSMKIVNFKL